MVKFLIFNGTAQCYGCEIAGTSMPGLSHSREDDPIIEK